MRFEILGPLRVIDGDAEVDLGGPRQQRVLAALLAAAPSALSVDRLIDEVWGEQPPETAAHVIRTYASALRKVFGDRLDSDGQRYRIATDEDSVDADEFTAAIGAARDVLTSDPARAAALLHDVDQLWRGRPFDGLCDDAPVVERRTIELTEQHLQSIEMFMEAELSLGRHEHVISKLESLAREHPFRERIHQCLMLALYRSGRQAEALAAGWTLRNRLVEELGIEPSGETRTLEDRILLQDQGLDLAPPSNLPAFVSSFVGRGREVAEVSKLADVDRLVTLVGTGGVGKTRLAREVACEILHRFPDGVCWVELASLAPGGSVGAKVAEAFGLTDQPGIDAAGLLGRYLASRRALLVFDNCEHVADDVARLVTQLLEVCEHVHVLATSRRVLHASGEVRYYVPPMSLPFGALGVSDAERLFVERSTQVDGRFAATDQTLGDIAAICRSLEGLPLAIEMASAQVAVLSPADIAMRVAGNVDLSTQDASAPARHRSLAATIQWSYDLLTEEQQLLFDRLAVFVGSFDVPAVEAVAGWAPLVPGVVVDRLGELVDASMVAAERRSDGRIRYRLLDSLRSFGRDQLEHRRESEASAGRHRDYFLGLAQSSADVWLTPAHADAMEGLAAANDDLLAALEWSLEHEPRSSPLGSAAGLVSYWFWRADPANAYSYGQRLLEVAEHETPATLAAAHLCVGFGAQQLGDFALAAASVAAAIEILERTDDWKLLLWAYNGQGQAGVFVGAPELSAAMGRAILALCEAHDGVLPRSYGLALLGEAEFFGDGDFAAARRFFDDAAPMLRELRDDAGLNMFVLGVLAATAALQLDFDAAEQAAIEASTLGGPGWSATALIILGGYVLHPRGETDRAETVTKQGVARAYERSMDVWVRTGLLVLGRIAADRGRWEEAARLFGGCRPMLPPWAQHRRWWNYEATVRAALGAERYDEIAAAAAEEPLDNLVAWAVGRDVGSVALSG